jgi:hypothetical protein
VELALTRDDVRTAVRHLDGEVARLIRTVLEGRNREGIWQQISPRNIDKVVFSGAIGKMLTVRETLRPPASPRSSSIARGQFDAPDGLPAQLIAHPDLRAPRVPDAEAHQLQVLQQRTICGHNW